ncbi:MAG: T9SS type A sorting domain-containing protein [Flavipsychrobacter sp.]
MRTSYTTIIILIAFSSIVAGQSPKPSSSLCSELKSGSGEKRTGVSSRWYNYYDYIDMLLGNTFSSGQNTVLPIWHDPGMLISSSLTGSDTVSYLSVAQVIDPSAGIFNNDTDLINKIDTSDVAGNMIHVRSADGYFVDSVSIRGIYYVAKPLRTQADSLIISITPNKKYYIDTATWISSFGVKDTLYAFAPTNVDSVNRCAYSDTLAYKGKTWAIPLTVAMAAGVSNFKFAPPGGSVFIPAGYHAAITVTFKSTDSWTKNVDSIGEYNRFMPLFGYEYPYPAGGYMTYWRGTIKNNNDCNGSALMYSTDTARYIPTIMDQGRHLPVTKFDAYEYADIGALISCATCKSIATRIQNISSVITAGSAYPNPANNELIIPIILSRPANVQIDLVSMFGQILQTKNIDRVLNKKAIFNVKELSEGQYFYIIKAGGDQQTGRFAIVH